MYPFKIRYHFNGIKYIILNKTLKKRKTYLNTTFAQRIFTHLLHIHLHKHKSKQVDIKPSEKYILKFLLAPISFGSYPKCQALSS